MIAWMIGAAMLRAAGDGWARQIRFAQVMQAAALQQSRVFWGLAPPVRLGNICAPSGFARPARQAAALTWPPAPEVEDVPV